MKKIYKYVLVISGIAAGAYALFWITASMVFSGAFDKRVTYEDAAKNFITHEADIMAFSEPLHSNRPKDHEVSIFVDDNDCKVSIGLPSWSVMQQFPNRHFEFEISSVKSQSPFLKELGWDLETFYKIVASLTKTNCSSSRTRDDIVFLGYKTGTWNSYGYAIYAQPVADSVRKNHEAQGILFLNSRARITGTSAL